MRYRDLFERVASPHLATPAFERWFAGSKVVDGHGQPLPVFHGTYQEFSEFKRDSERHRSYSMNRLGFWFDIDPETPGYFGGFDASDPHRDANAGSVLVAYLAIKRPLTFSSEPTWHGDEAILRGHQARGDHVAFHAHLDQMDRQDSYDHMIASIPKPPNDPRYPNPLADPAFEPHVEAFRDDAIAQGYDGIYLPDTYADTGSRGGRRTDWWIAFHPEQIKAVMGNRGTFDPADPDITK